MYFLIKLLIKYDPRSWFEILILGWGLVSNMFTCGALRDGLSFAGYNYRVWLSTIWWGSLAFGQVTSRRHKLYLYFNIQITPVMPKENQTKIGHIKLPTNLKQVDVDNMSSKQFACVFL